MADHKTHDNGEPQYQPPGFWRLVLFAFPSLPHAFVVMPLNIVLPQFYAGHTTVTLLQIASVTTASRLLDAVLDPMIGYLSDRTKSLIGRRKPWVLAGAIICALSIFFLFRPPQDATYVYYGIWSFFLYFGFTLFEIPRAAWTAELSRNYFERSRINTFVAVFNVTGALVFWLTPLLLVGITGTTAITGTTLSAIAWLYALLMPVGILLSVGFVTSGASITGRLATVRELIHSLKTAKPLWIFYGTVAAWGLGQGAYLSLLLIFLSDYMHMAALFPFLMMLYFIVQVAALPFWHRMIARYGKHRIWAFAMASDVLTRPLILLLPHAPSLFLLLPLGALGAFLSAPCNNCPPAILGDVVDYDLMKSRVNKAGNLFAFNTLLTKSTMAAGSGLSFLLLALFHYHVGGANTPLANAGLVFGYLGVPAIFFLIAAAIAWNFPLNAARHDIIRRRLEGRAAVAKCAALQEQG